MPVVDASHVLGVRVASLARGLAVAVLLASSGSAAAIAYTVQVIAVSDQESALSISRDLLREGYPAYVVRSTGAQGDVFRVRVGAFANRAAALRYAESMPDVAGSRPVPALAEAIPAGIMPLAPRLLWQAEWQGEDVRAVPWPGGVALRVQRVDPLRQAEYLVFQDGEERRFDAWLALPLTRVPEPAREPELDVPIVDLTQPAPPAAEAADAVPEGDGGDAADDATPAAADADPDAHEPIQGDAADAVADAPVDPLDEVLALVADPASEQSEAGLLLLRDVGLWPPTWRDDEDGVRDAFRASAVTLLARALDLGIDDVDALAYAPAGEPPPGVIVLDVSDRSARDAGRPLALGDTSAGIRLFGPERFVPSDVAGRLPAWPTVRIRPDADAPAEPLGGDAWDVRSDGGFVRITLRDGATWRAGVGTPLWTDGRVVVAWDGERLLLYDFVPR